MKILLLSEAKSNTHHKGKLQEEEYMFSWAFGSKDLNPSVESICQRVDEKCNKMQQFTS